MTLSDITLETTLSMPLEITERQMQEFAQLSGDQNPVHLDPTYALQRGFKGPVVYGALLVAAVSRLLGMEIPGPGCVWHSVSMQFKSPFYAHEKAQVNARVSYLNHDLGVLRLKIDIVRGEDLIASGEVQAGFPRSGHV